MYDPTKEDVLNELKSFGVTKSDYEKSENKLAQEANTIPNPILVCWDIYNQLVLEFTKSKNFSKLSFLYYQMALLADKTGKKSTQKYLEQSQYWKLIEYENNGLTKIGNYVVSISSSADSCAPCASQEGKTYTIQQALEEKPLPHKDCTFSFGNEPGFCRCEYSLVEKEQLISPKPEQKPTNKSKALSPRNLTIIIIVLLLFVFCCCIIPIISNLVSSS